MREHIIVALDVSTNEELTQLLSYFKKEKPSVKIGMELFYQQGPSLINSLKDQGFDIFLDLKLHDIPTTVYKAMRGLARLGVDMVNVHAAGGSKMMKAALEGLEEGTPPGKKRPLCIAVTQLTSTDHATLQKEILIPRQISDVVVSYSGLAASSGLDGVVCSPWEVSAIKENVNHHQFLTVTPGIRLADDDVNDQKRVATPAKARQLGSDYIVVGRSITKASEPDRAYEHILQEWSGLNVE